MFAVVSGLSHGKTYACRLQAINRFGMSPAGKFGPSVKA
jgi:hypothetical protein